MSYRFWKLKQDESKLPPEEQFIRVKEYICKEDVERQYCMGKVEKKIVSSKGLCTSGK